MVDFAIDIENQRLLRGETPLKVRNKAFELLELFVANPGRLLSTDHILEEIWGDACVTDALVREYVHDLRQALGDNPRHPRYIETVPRRGYRFLGGISADFGTRTPGVLSRGSGYVQSVAVLPFTNLSDDPENDRLAKGISEEIIVGLTRHPHLSLISRHSSFAFRKRALSAKDTGRRLGASFLVEGSVRRLARGLRITAMLVDCAADASLWVATYDHEGADIREIYDDVVGAIVHALGSIDGVIERAVLSNRAGLMAVGASAYDCYLLAQHCFYRHGDAGYDEAELYYRKSIRIDPVFPRARSALGMLLFLRFKKFLSVPFSTIEKEAYDLAAKAIQLDPDDYLGHWLLGLVYSYAGKGDQGLCELRRAVRINPNDADLLADLSDYLVYAGRTKEALECCRRAIKLNPECPDYYWWNLGFAYFHLGRYRDALESIASMASPGQAHRLAAAVYAQLGSMNDAQDEARSFLAANPGFSINEWATREPYDNPRERQRYVEGLRKAGLPE